jgi:di/tricarboxylate transporter
LESRAPRWGAGAPIVLNVLLPQDSCVTPQGWITLSVLAGTLALLIRGRTAPAMVVSGAVILLLAMGVVTPADALSGFSNPAPFTVAALFVVARAVEKTGGLQPLLGVLLGGGRGEKAERPNRKSLARFLGPVAGASALLNNTPIVAMVAPQVEAWAERRGQSPSHYLMPLSFASILGGVVTVIGTSTTIVVSGLLESQGMPAIGMFEISRVGLPLALAGLVFLVLFSPLLLPVRRGALREFEEEFREYTVNLVVTPGGPLEGKTVEEGGLTHLDGAYLAEVRRGTEIIAPASHQTHLEGGDLVTFAGRPDTVLGLRGIRGLKSAEAEHTMEIARPGHTYFEVVVGADSPLAGRTLKEVEFRQEYRAVALAMHRSGGRFQGKLAEVPLMAGDTLVLLAGPRFRMLWRHRRDFLVISHLGGAPPSSTRQAILVGGVLVGIVSLAALGIFPVLQGSLLGAFLLVATRVMTPSEALDAVDLGVIFLIAGAFGMGAAIQSSGLAAELAHGIMGLASGLGPTGALLGVLLTTILLTEIITNNAAAVLIFPIAMATATNLGLDPRPFAIAIAVGASASFLTPIGYQTNTMVYGPGGYRFGDYARLGMPLTLLVIGMVIWLVPHFWAF